MMIDTPADAFAVAAVLMVGADRIGTDEERRYVFERMSGLDVFEGMSSGSFANLIARTTDQLCTAYSMTDARFSDESVASLAESMAAVLDPDLRIGCLRMARELAGVDGLSSAEDRLLGQLCDGLGVDRAALA